MLWLMATQPSNMKQVLLALGLLLLTMAVYYWAGNRFVPKKANISASPEKQILFEVPENILVETEKEIKLKAKHEKGKIVSFLLNLNYKPEEVKILSTEVNKEVFNSGIEVQIDENLGKIILSGRYEGEKETLINEEVNLATIKIRGLKRGETTISVEKTPVIEVWDGEKITEESFQLLDFKLKFL